MNIKLATTTLLLAISVMALCLPHPSFANMPGEPLTQQQLEARYYLRDYSTVKTTLDAVTRPLNTDEQLLLLAIDVELQTPDVDDALEAFAEAHPNNAKVQYWAGNLWQTIAKNSNLFSKISLYSQYVKAMTRAAELAPDNPRYQMEAAKAYGQPAMMGGDSDKQAPIVATLRQGPSPLAHIAYMDLLQNQQREHEAVQFARAIARQYPSNPEILERAAQLLWTFDDVAGAGELFSKACLLPAPAFEAYSKWDNACWTSMLFGVDGRLPAKTALQVSSHFVDQAVVQDADYLEALHLHGQLLVKNQQTALAVQAYQQLLSLAEDKSLKRAAQKALKRLARP